MISLLTVWLKLVGYLVCIPRVRITFHFSKTKKYHRQLHPAAVLSFPILRVITAAIALIWCMIYDRLIQQHKKNDLGCWPKLNEKSDKEDTEEEFVLIQNYKHVIEVKCWIQEIEEAPKPC
jgi:hypothetical protein